MMMEERVDKEGVVWSCEVVGRGGDDDGGDGW